MRALCKLWGEVHQSQAVLKHSHCKPTLALLDDFAHLAMLVTWHNQLETLTKSSWSSVVPVPLRDQMKEREKIGETVDSQNAVMLRRLANRQTHTEAASS